MFENLLKPGQIGKMTVKNRMKYASTTTCICDDTTGEVTDAEIAYLAERAQGSAGIVTTGGGYPHIVGKGYPGQMGLDNDSLIPGLRRLAQAIQANGARAVAQVMHVGRYAHPELAGLDEPPVGPTAMMPKILLYKPCRELTHDEIVELVELHGQASRRVKEAGYDAVELCGVVGYLVSNFLCKWTNKRTDEYGGSLENRARFFLEIIERTRELVGLDYPIIIRLNANDRLADGNSEEEYLEIAKMCEAKGVDAISLTVGWHESDYPAITQEIRPGYWLYLAEKWKKAGIKVPLMMAYRLTRPEIADRAIANGIIDYWEMCRPMMADPYLPLKVIESRPEDIAICPACNFGCFSFWAGIRPGAHLKCTMNPRLEKEWDESYQVKPANEKKKVMVVGGGPAGMEAAMIAAQRGHDVSLYEKSDRLGGQLNYLAKAPFCEEWADVVKYFATQMNKTGVKVNLKRKVTANLIRTEKPDAVIIATGAKPQIPQIPGINRDSAITIFDVLSGKALTGRRVVVLGAKAAAIQTADYLASLRKEVTVVTELPRWGRDIPPTNKWGYRLRLRENGVKILRSTKVKEITDTGVVVVTPDGQEQLIEADTVVISTLEADKELERKLAGRTDQVQSVGDCVAPRIVHSAIVEGFLAGNRV